MVWPLLLKWGLGWEMLGDISYHKATLQSKGKHSIHSGGNQSGLNAIWLPHCHRPVKNHKAIIWTNIRTTVTRKARKWEKWKNLKNQATRSGVVVWYAIRGPAMFVEHFLRLWWPSNSSQMSSCITVTKIVAIVALLGWYTAIFVMKFKASPYLFTITRGRRLGDS